MPPRTDNSGRRWIHDECNTEHHPAEDCPHDPRPAQDWLDGWTDGNEND